MASFSPVVVDDLKADLKDLKDLNGGKGKGNGNSGDAGGAGGAGATRGGGAAYKAVQGGRWGAGAEDRVPLAKAAAYGAYESPGYEDPEGGLGPTSRRGHKGPHKGPLGPQDDDNDAEF